MQNKSSAFVKLLKRLGAMFYDGLIVIALLMLATVLLLPFNHGLAIRPGNYLYSIYLITVVFSYFCFSWCRSGQTIGLRAWKLQVCSLNGGRIDILQALLRFGFAIPSLLLVGLGLWWSLIDEKQMAWHDRWSRTMIKEVTLAAT